jgi:hypothetical protein
MVPRPVLRPDHDAVVPDVEVHDRAPRHHCDERLHATTLNQYMVEIAAMNERVGLTEAAPEFAEQGHSSHDVAGRTVTHDQLLGEDGVAADVLVVHSPSPGFLSRVSSVNRTRSPSGRVRVSCATRESMYRVAKDERHARSQSTAATPFRLVRTTDRPRGRSE